MCGWSRAATSSCASYYDHDRGYIFQNADGRIVFAIPYESDYTLIGTTDRDYEAIRTSARISDEKRYLCGAASEYFARAGDAGRDRLDLFGRPAAIRRRRHRGAGGDARLCAQGRRRRGERALINVFGGKITTYRRLGERARAHGDGWAARATWTEGATLPGGDFP